MILYYTAFSETTNFFCLAVSNDFGFTYIFYILFKNIQQISHTKEYEYKTVDVFHPFAMSYSVRVIVILGVSFFVSGVVTEQQKISPVPTSQAPSSGFVPLQVCVHVLHYIIMFYVKMWIQ